MFDRESYFDKCLCDLGASVNLMPYSVFKKLGITNLEPTNISLHLANHSIVISTPGNKYPSATDIDQIISTEIPSHEDDPELYRLVQNHMIHGPCGILQPNSLYMKEGKYSRFYPKQFQPQTLLDSNGYPVYRRRNNGHLISKSCFAHSIRGCRSL